MGDSPGIMERESFAQLAKFALGSAVLFSLCAVLPGHLLAPLNAATARAAAAILALLGGRPELAGTVITLDGFRVDVVTECTSLYGVLLILAFILSVPATLRSRLAGFAAGASLITGFNILRIAAVAGVGAARPELFAFVHVYLGQVVMLLFVVGVSLSWQRWSSGSPEGNAPFLVRAVVAASLLYPLWFLANRSYVEALDRIVRGIFLLAGYRLYFSYGHLAYYQTFNMVLLLALLFAEDQLPRGRRIAWILAGSALLVGGHLLFRSGNVLLSAFGWEPALQWTLTLSIVGEYLLPVLLWRAATAGAAPRAAVKPARPLVGA